MRQPWRHRHQLAWSQFVGFPVGKDGQLSTQDVKRDGASRPMLGKPGLSLQGEQDRGHQRVAGDNDSAMAAG
jgi:hypothetical protein